MTETKTEFVKRKKSEKRLQAERQVREAYQNCVAGYSLDQNGEKEFSKGYIVNDKFIHWRIRMEPEIEDLYSTIDISKALNMPRERLRDWMVRGFISPSLPSTSKGTIAIFTRNDILCVVLFQKLIDMGFKREVASEYITLFVNSNLINAVNFLLLVYTERDGKPAIELKTHSGDTLNLTIDSDGVVRQGNSITSNAQDWEGIHILNMVTLDKQVDAALATVVD